METFWYRLPRSTWKMAVKTERGCHKVWQYRVYTLQSSNRWYIVVVEHWSLGQWTSCPKLDCWLNKWLLCGQPVCYQSASMANSAFNPCWLVNAGHRSGGSWGGGLDPLKICRRGQSRLWPPLKNVTFFHSKLLLDNSTSFTSSRMKDLFKKWKVKLIFWGAYRLSRSVIVKVLGNHWCRV